MVLQDEISRAVAEQIEFIRNKEIGLKRSVLEKVHLSSDLVLIITGIRRCGKSTLMHQLMFGQKTDYSFFNFEDSRIAGFELSDFSKLLDSFDQKNNCYFFDEIQNVEGWEIFVRQLHDRKKTICITGSNASLLSREMGTKLTGRNLQVELFPFSFQEFCRFKKIKQDEAAVKYYLLQGGFPGLPNHSANEYLQQLFKDIVYRDIIVRHGIRNAKTFIDIALHLISNIGKPLSFTGIRNSFKVGAVNSVVDYVNWLEDAYVLFTVPRFSWSPKSVAVNAKKIYAIDTGFARANSLSFSEDDGRLFENMVYLELRRKHKEIFYFREKGECDFVVKEGKKILHVIQVCSKVTGDNMKREVDGLVEALELLKLKNGTIVTLNQKDSFEVDGKKINLVPVYTWMKSLNE